MPALWRRLPEPFRSWLGKRTLQVRVAGLDARLDRGAICDVLPLSSADLIVKDGLEALAESRGASCRPGSRILEMPLFRSRAAVSEYRLYINVRPAVRRVELPEAPEVGAVLFHAFTPRFTCVVAPEFALARPEVADGDTHLLPARTPVRDATTAMRQAPLMRRSLEMRRMTEWERDALLAEAGQSRALPAHVALVAVFPKVPVEWIDRVRFHAPSSTLFYTVNLPRGAHQTRVHDLAAIQDRTSGETQLVPLRARFRTTTLMG